MPAKEKIDIVSSLKDKLERSQSVIIADYRGLTVAEVNELREKMRGANVEYRVAKNRLMKLALTECNFETQGSPLKGPSAFIFGYADPVTAAKILTEFAKTHDDLQIKGGWLEKRTLTADGVRQLASMPSREELLARLAGSLKSPISRVAIGLRQSVSKIAYAIKAVADAKKEAA